MLHPDIAAVLAGDSEGCIVCADGLEVMADMPDGCVDAVVTDPPFGAGRAFANDAALDFPVFCKRFAAILDILSAPNVLIEVSKADVSMRRAVIEIGYDLKWSIALSYVNATARQGAVGYTKWGLVLWFSREGGCYQRYADRIDAPCIPKSQFVDHPSPKLVRHYQKICAMFSRKGNIILDPFCGSGTTCVAAKKLGRRWIGIEIDPKYADIARGRVERTPAPMVVNGEVREVKGKAGFF